jgi:deazaflavin-dependent oxidoreductase (nitroreductase family)
MPVDANKSLMPTWLPAFNLKVTNRIQGVYAPYVPPLAVVVHVGRKSGKVFTIPVAASLYDGKVAIPLPYSANTQWVKNLQAAGGGEMIRRGKRFSFTNPRILTEAAGETLPPMAARAVKRMPVLIADVA